jgi:hypothetical protein
MSHTGRPKAHRCTFEGCGKVFHTASQLSIHVGTHTGECKFKCSFAGNDNNCLLDIYMFDLCDSPTQFLIHLRFLILAYLIHGITHQLLMVVTYHSELSEHPRYFLSAVTSIHPMYRQALQSLWTVITVAT